MRCLKLGRFFAQAFLHERFALVALDAFALGINVAGFHFALLGGGFGLGTQALFHERFALIALFVFGVHVAGFHFALLAGFGITVSGVRCHAQRQ